MCAKLLQSCLTLCPYGLKSARLLCPGDSPSNSMPSSSNLPNPGIKPTSLYVSCIGMFILYH